MLLITRGWRKKGGLLHYVLYSSPFGPLESRYAAYLHYDLYFSNTTPLMLCTSNAVQQPAFFFPALFDIAHELIWHNEGREKWGFPSSTYFVLLNNIYLFYVLDTKSFL